MDPKKYKQLQSAITAIRNEHGSSVVEDKPSAQDISKAVIRSGCLGLDVALGVGGFCRGRPTEIFGGPDSGKTSLALLAIAEAQKAGGAAAFINVDGLLDLNWARKLGVNTDELVVIKPGTGEATFDILEKLIRSYALDVIVTDSIATMVPNAELQGNFGDQERDFLHAQLMSKGMRRVNPLMSRSNAAYLFTNQLRVKFDKNNPEEVTEEATGGNAMRYYATCRIKTFALGEIQVNGSHVGARVGAKVIRNKLAPIGLKAEMIFNHNGFDCIENILSVALHDGIVKKMGKEFRFQDKVIGKTKEEAMKTLSGTPQMAETIENAVRSFHLIGPEVTGSKEELSLVG